MSPIQEYFFDNNIEVWTKKDTGTVVYYNTDAGEYVVDLHERLFKIEGSEKMFVSLLKKNDPMKSESEELTHCRKEQLILKMTYDALVETNLEVNKMEQWKTYREGGRLSWQLVERKKQAQELSLLYDDLARDRVKLVEIKQEPDPSPNESSPDVYKTIH